MKIVTQKATIRKPAPKKAVPVVKKPVPKVIEPVIKEEPVLKEYTYKTEEEEK